ncbi:efflux RND transporter periplasmic adaptor subunit [Prosthecobacter sp.]|uniref:efflux RND transporter periplasmic adaptor subunit n=1 Tax=Prosthecobacter sp. TaxID=1965333 RepID=UPI0037831213
MGRNFLCFALCLAAALASTSCGRQQTLLVLTKPLRQDTMVTRTYVCEIHPIQSTKILAPERGYLDEVSVQEGQQLKAGAAMFKLLPQARNNAPKRTDSQPQVPEPPRITTITAPFDGQTGRLRLAKGSVVKKNEALTTLTDNTQVWADFHMPEAQYKEYSASAPADKMNEVKLILANRKLFDQTGTVSPPAQTDAKSTDSVLLRALFPNPKKLLRPGQAGNIRMQNKLKNALLVPLQSTFEISHHRYLFVVDKDHVIRQRKISVTHELDNLLVVSAGVGENDTIIFNAAPRVREGEKASNYQFEEPAAAFAPLLSKK